MKWNTFQHQDRLQISVKLGDAEILCETRHGIE